VVNDGGRVILAVGVISRQFNISKRSKIIEKEGILEKEEI